MSTPFGAIEFTRIDPDKLVGHGSVGGVANCADCGYSYACSG
jgi:hypothetical protein